MHVSCYVHWDYAHRAYSISTSSQHHRGLHSKSSTFSASFLVFKVFTSKIQLHARFRRSNRLDYSQLYSFTNSRFIHYDQTSEISLFVTPKQHNYLQTCKHSEVKIKRPWKAEGRVVLKEANIKGCSFPQNPSKNLLLFLFLTVIQSSSRQPTDQTGSQSFASGLLSSEI